MKKVVIESLNEGEYYSGYGGVDPYEPYSKEEVALRKADDALQKVKKHCESVIVATTEYFQSLEDEGMDTDDLDSDEKEYYISNTATSDLANQILNIIKKVK